MHPKQLFKKYQIKPKKSLGQNFLFDENILARIVAAAELSPEDRVLEIGPGLGTLTSLLAKKAASVVAVELDDRLIPILQKEVVAFENVELFHGDILEDDPSRWINQPYKVVANVPYYITGAILRHLLSSDNRPTLMVLTVQKEVAERITAVPPQMSLLSVSTQFYGKVEIVNTIKAGAFWPRPDVDSAVICIDLKNREMMERNVINPGEENMFFRVVKAGFSQKRKQLKNNLRLLGYTKEKIALILLHAHIDSDRRPQTLTLDEWWALTMAFIEEENTAY